MQFLVLGHDGKDGDTLARRLASRDDHLQGAHRLQELGHLLFAVALLDEAGTMCGSAMTMEYESRADLDAYLRQEPYVTGNVWQDVQVIPCRVGPTFAKG